MDLRQLRYFVAVAEEGQISRAAERLGLEQPPLSQQIKAMEAALGTRLFHRRPRGMALTEAGEALLSRARAVLAGMQAAVLHTQRAGRGDAGRLSLAVAPTAPFHPFVPRVIRAFREAWPEVAVTMEESLSRPALEGLRDGRLDAAFLRARVSETGIATYPLLDERMVLALPAGHRLAGRGALGLAALGGEPLIPFGRVEGPGIFDATLAACLRAGFTPRIGQEAPRITSALGLVAAGLGVCLVPASMLRVRMDGVAYRPLRAAEAPVVVLDLAVRRDATSPVLRNFLALARRAA